eukprot:CAMPEP_0119050982 /NCGR_PEP_ID=MMETSP1177-20130426/72746_1 /TAXON_ID=2985 /ORGANISM="Ochromonas sp, Strain CCMP1899" /LENGTH=161 /DNA_ID=CAMNT_0007030027 /DNA_START=635 /DNA_END=1117 /DNA_ORIENTATION=-
MTQKELCNKKLIGDYAEYLSSTCKSLTSGNLLKMGTATQYLSGLVTELRIKYPDDSIWEGITDLKVTPVWYHNIIDRVEKDVKKKCADNGVPVSKKVLGVGRELLKRTVDYKMSLGTAEGCRDIFTMVRLFLYHGRGKELTYSTYDDIRVDEDQEEMKSDW